MKQNVSKQVSFYIYESKGMKCREDYTRMYLFLPRKIKMTVIRFQ